MPGDSIEQWEHSQAELEIRRWLYAVGLWAPGAENFGREGQEDDVAPGSLSQEQIEQVLLSEHIGRIGCHADGKTYVVPIAYAYDDGCIYAHSGDGLKLRMMRSNPQVCFEVEQVENMTNWQSVIAWGRFEELHGADADRAVALLTERLKPLVGEHTDSGAHQKASPASAPVALEQGRPVVYRIVLSQRTGRYDVR